MQQMESKAKALRGWTGVGEKQSSWTAGYGLEGEVLSLL